MWPKLQIIKLRLSWRHCSNCVVWDELMSPNWMILLLLVLSKWTEVDFIDLMCFSMHIPTGAALPYNPLATVKLYFTRKCCFCIFSLSQHHSNECISGVWIFIFLSWREEIKSEPALPWASADCTSSSSLGWRPQQDILCHQPVCACTVCVRSSQHGLWVQTSIIHQHRPFLKKTNLAVPSLSLWDHTEALHIKTPGHSVNSSRASVWIWECEITPYNKTYEQVIWILIIWAEGSLRGNEFPRLIGGWLSVFSPASVCLPDYLRASPFIHTSCVSMWEMEAVKEKKKAD